MLWRVISQTVVRKTDRLAQAAGYVTEETTADLVQVLRRGTGVGLLVALFMGLEGNTTLLVVREGNTYAYRPSGGVGFTLGWTH